MAQLSPDCKRHCQLLLLELACSGECDSDLVLVAADGRRSRCNRLVMAAASPVLFQWLLDGGDCAILPDVPRGLLDLFCSSLLVCPDGSEDIGGILEVARILGLELGFSFSEADNMGTREGELITGDLNKRYEIVSNSDLLDRDKTTVKDEILEENMDKFNIVELKVGEEVLRKTEEEALAGSNKGSTEFCCSFCDANFVTYTDLQLHLACHKIEADFNCDDCQQNFDSLDQLSRHCREIHGNMDCTESGELAFLMEGSSGSCVYSLGQDEKIEKKFQCSKCTKNFTTKVQLKHHMNIHLGLRPYTCKVCGKGFTQPTHLKVHKRTHDGSRPYMCSVCGRTFAIASNMRKHLAIHDREAVAESHNSSDVINTADKEPVFLLPDFVPMTNHPCRHCQVTFNTKRELLSHLAGHAEINPFHCLVQDCQARFPSQKKLAVHERRLHGKQHSCTYCGRVCVSASQLDKHVLTHTGEKPHKCDQCGKAFTQKSHVTHHINTVHGDGGLKEKKHVCQECGKGFVTKAVLIKHSMLHSNERPYHCNVCPKKFVQKSHLKVHLSKHTGERPFLCLECGKSFSTKQHLKEHNKLHTGSKPWYECPQCDAKYRGQADLTIHMRLHTGETPFACDQCDKTFRSERSLENHARIHSGTKPFQCGACMKCFTTPSGLRQHFKHNMRCRAQARPGSFSTKAQLSDGGSISLAGMALVTEPQILVQGEEAQGQINISSVPSILDIKQVGITDMKQIIRLDIKGMDAVNLSEVEKVTSYG